MYVSSGMSKMEAMSYMASQLEKPIMEKVWNPLSVESMQFVKETPGVIGSPLGVFGIGGLAGYTMAMNRYRANELLDTAMKCAVLTQVRGDGRYERQSGRRLPLQVPPRPPQRGRCKERRLLQSLLGDVG